MDRWMNNNNNNEIKSPRAAKPPNFQKKGWQVPNFMQDIIIYVSQEDDVMCLL